MFRYIAFNDAIEKFLALAISVKPAVLILITCHDAPTQAAIGIEGRGDVAHITLFVPASVTCADVAPEGFTVGTFTHHVHRCSRIASAGHQAVCATHNLYTIINGSIFLRIAKVPRVAH